MHTKILVWLSEERDHLEDIGVDDILILESILGRNGRKLWTGCIWFRTGTSRGLL